MYEVQTSPLFFDPKTVLILFHSFRVSVKIKLRRRGKKLNQSPRNWFPVSWVPAKGFPRSDPWVWMGLTNSGRDIRISLHESRLPTGPIFNCREAKAKSWTKKNRWHGLISVFSVPYCATTACRYEELKPSLASRQCRECEDRKNEDWMSEWVGKKRISCGSETISVTSERPLGLSLSKNLSSGDASDTEISR